MDNIYKRMLKIEAELSTVAKNLKVETGKGNGYKAVSERDVIDAVKPLEAKYGVYSYPSSREVLSEELLESESQYDKKTSFFTRVKTIYRFVNVDEPTEFIETTVFSEGIDSQDKGSGKAMTYADKYALMKAYKISTGDDPDQNASQEASYATLNDKKNFKASCERLGVNVDDILKDVGHVSGKPMTSDQYAKALIRLKEISDGRNEDNA